MLHSYDKQQLLITCLVVSVFHPGALSDFFALNSANWTWTNLADIVSGTWPGPRHSFGFASAGEDIFVFGGESDSGRYFTVLISRAQIPHHSFIHLLHFLTPTSYFSYECRSFLFLMTLVISQDFCNNQNNCIEVLN